MTNHLGNKSLRNILFAVILVLGVALSITVSALSYYADKKLIQAEFNEAAENRYSAFKREIDSDLSALASLQALYNSSRKGVERSEFRNFTNHILKQHASIQALEWMPRVPDSRREAYERAARREGFPDFQLTERIAQGKMRREEKRKEYFPVYFVEPYKGNEIALGFDLASNPERLETLEAARKTGEISATGRITLVQESKGQAGFIVFAPIYRKGALINSDQPRRDNLEGFALGVFRISDIVEKAMNYLKPEGVDIFIYDVSEPEKERFLYAYSSDTRKTFLLNQDQPETDIQNTKTVEVAGRKWMVIYSAAPDFIAAKSSWHPWGLLLAGLAVTGLVAGFLFIVSHAEHLETFANDLSDANANLAYEIMERKNAHEQLRDLAAHLQSVREEERTKIARDIHDELGQTLTAQKMELSWFREKYGDHKPIFDKAGAMLDVLNATIRSVKRICTDLRPSLLDDFGLVDAMQWQANEFQTRTRIECVVDSVPEVIELDKELSTALFRIFQEALTNVLKHAKATKVTAILTIEDDNIMLEVIDNGKGVTDEELSKPQSFGIMGMRERVYPWGGKVQVTCHKNGGAIVKVCMPHLT